MRFNEKLNEYIDVLGVTRKDLAKASGLSAATVTRYCSGEREPHAGSERVRQLAAGIASLAGERGMDGADEASVLEALTSCLDDAMFINYESFVINLNSLLQGLDIKASELARSIYSDPSYVSRILSGSRKPANPKEFIEDVSTFIARRCEGGRGVASLALLTGADPSELDSAAAIHDRVSEWLGSEPSSAQEDPIPKFLSSMDSFDLNDYLVSVRYDEIKIPSVVPPPPADSQGIHGNKAHDGKRAGFHEGYGAVKVHG